MKVISLFQVQKRKVQTETAILIARIMSNDKKKKKRAGSLDCVLYPILEKFVWSLKSKLRHNNNDCMRIGQKNVQFYCLINK